MRKSAISLTPVRTGVAKPCSVFLMPDDLKAYKRALDRRGFSSHGFLRRAVASLLEEDSQQQQKAA